MRLRLATRASELAVWQAERVASLLRAAHPALEVALVAVSTTGDRRPEVPVWEMGGRGVFVADVQAQVLEGRADAAVHSAKDLQPLTAPGLVLAALPERADRRDVLVGSRLADLAPGALVATGSQRRRAQLAHLRPDLDFTGLRGNIGTRLGKVPPGGAVLVAAAALQRLGLQPSPSETLAEEVMLPQVGQGAIAVECRGDDRTTRSLLEAVDDAVVRAEVEAERAFLATIGGGCDLPVAGSAVLGPAGSLVMTGLLAATDGRELVRRWEEGGQSEAAALGGRVARSVLDGGGRALLAGGGPVRPSGEPR